MIPISKSIKAISHTFTLAITVSEILIFYIFDLEKEDQGVPKTTDGFSPSIYIYIYIYIFIWYEHINVH